MKFSLALISTSLLIAISQAATVKFNVIAPSATDVKVSVNGQQVSLTASDPNVPYFTGNAEVGSAKDYKYVIGGVEESFTRALDSSKSSTLNDFMNRPVTYANIPKLPWPIKNNPQWTRSVKPEIYDENYIPSVFFTGDSAAVDAIVKNVPKDKVTGTLTFIGADYLHTFQNVTFGLHGAGKKKNNAKQSWNWSLSPGDSLGNRTFFKLRHMEEDPTQLRERLYSDVLHALGTYANEATMIRLFINGDGFGTFNILDDITEFSYVNALFHGGQAPAKQGLLFDGASGADFLYHPGNLDGYSSWIPNNANEEGYEAFDPLCKAFNETNVKDNAALANFEKQFDTDHFMRFMVMEYLAGHWDGYWMLQTNDGAYREAETNKWYYLGQDYDATFGVNLAVADANAFMTVSYKDWPSLYPGGVMINRLLENTDKRAQFENYLTETVRVLFNNYTLTNRALALHKFLLPDLEWDRSIVQRSPGINFGWVFNQVSDNLWNGVEAPNNNGGGASWGLIQWIAQRSAAVAKEFNISIVTEPVGPPNGNSSITPGGDKPSSPSSSSSSSSPSSSSKASDNSSSNSNTSAQSVDESAALPRVSPKMALIVLSAIAATIF
ncbi:coth protein-domain-containing protein [Cokeromyces recurvatus]|uniref:coth protein-domain-containing protein n=1 Tax=Cokeromyces recurvatus TaxID=90255 RepID=UPI00221FA889|nr:coth protein-domain-containing protein [Cokeromyces recurvatus]KAI7903665.1 coth protein-domain-containing protein [Cokeromyces recurvatus]